MPLLDNIVAYYKLDNVNDSVGSFNLTNNNTVAFNAGKIGNAGDGSATNTNKSLSIANNLGITGGNITISCWVNVTTAPSAAIYAFVDQADVTNDIEYGVVYRDVAGTKKIQYWRNKFNVATELVTVDTTLTVGT